MTNEANTLPEGRLGELAGRLSKAQRQMLVTAYETVFMHRMKMRGRNKAIRELGLAVKAWRGGDLLTPLGIALRQSLLNQEKPK